jgi:hypothetical protein
VLPATEIIPGLRAFTYGNDVAPGAVMDYPAILTHSFGKGRSVYFAGDVTGSYGRFGDPSLRLLLRNAIRWANRGPLALEIDAPLAVEVHPYRQGSRYVVCFMNYITSQLRLWNNVGGTAAEDVIPVRDISVRFRIDRQPSNVYMASSKQVLPFVTKNGVVSVRIPKIDVFDMLIVE